MLEQNFQFDLVSTDKLLQRYVDRPIVVDQVRGQATESFGGTLLSTQGGLVLKRDDGSVQILPHNAGVKLPSLPGGLITRPTLVWDVSAQRAGAAPHPRVVPDTGHDLVGRLQRRPIPRARTPTRVRSTSGPG